MRVKSSSWAESILCILSEELFIKTDFTSSRLDTKLAFHLGLVPEGVPLRGVGTVVLAVSSFIRIYSTFIIVSLIISTKPKQVVGRNGII